jgi:hypothetical protein
MGGFVVYQREKGEASRIRDGPCSRSFLDFEPGSAGFDIMGSIGSKCPVRGFAAARGALFYGRFYCISGGKEGLHRIRDGKKSLQKNHWIKPSAGGLCLGEAF